MINKFFLFRISTYLLIGVELFLLPTLILNIDSYAIFEYGKSIMGFVPLFALGINSGYLHLLLVKKNDSKESLVVINFVFLILFGLIIIFYTSSVGLFLAILSSGLAMSLEKIYQGSESYFKAVLFKPFFSFFSVFFWLILYIIDIKIFDSNMVYILLGCISLVSLLFYSFGIRLDFGMVNLKSLTNNFKNLIKHGFWINLNTFCLFSVIFIDRSFIKKYYFEILPEYSFIFNMSQIVIVVLTTFAYTYQVDLGKNLENITKRYFFNILAKSSFLFILGITFSFLFFKIYSSFNDNIYFDAKLFFLIVIPYSIFFMFSSISALAQYLEVQRRVSVFFLILVILNFLLFQYKSYMNIEIGYVEWLIKSFAVLIVFCVYQFLVIYRNCFSVVLFKK